MAHNLSANGAVPRGRLTGRTDQQAGDSLCFACMHACTAPHTAASPQSPHVQWMLTANAALRTPVTMGLRLCWCIRTWVVSALCSNQACMEAEDCFFFCDECPCKPTALRRLHDQKLNHLDVVLNHHQALSIVGCCGLGADALLLQAKLHAGHPPPSAWQAATFLLVFLGFINFVGLLVNWHAAFVLPWMAPKATASSLVMKQMLSVALPITNTAVVLIFCLQAIKAAWACLTW